MGGSDGTSEYSMSIVLIILRLVIHYRHSGKVGRVVHLYADGDVKVQVSGGCWIFNPLAVTKVTQTQSVEDGNEGKY